MAQRPGRCYRKKDKRPYTRVSKSEPSKRYVKGVPGLKIKMFEMGNRKKEFRAELRLKAKRGVQIRHNALEAARMASNKYLQENLGKENYFLKILVYPHHVMREKPIAVGAGADRYQQGMSKAFGKPAGKAARIDKGQELICACVSEKKIHVAREALKRAAYKLPTPCKIEQKLKPKGNDQ